MDRELQEAFGRNLRALRLERGLTQERMGEAMDGLNRTYVGSVERGERNLALQTVARLSRLAGVDPFDLLLRPADERASAGSTDLRAAASGADPGERA